MQIAPEVLSVKTPEHRIEQWASYVAALIRGQLRMLKYSYVDKWVTDPKGFVLIERADPIGWLPCAFPSDWSARTSLVDKRLVIISLKGKDPQYDSGPRTTEQQVIEFFGIEAEALRKACPGGLKHLYTGFNRACPPTAENCAIRIRKLSKYLVLPTRG